MILKKLELYNCLGILNGLGQEKIEIDFSSFKKGLILIQGRSGSGKSTLLNNCQPFRDGFKENFLPDGYRYLEFEFKGNHYLSQVYATKAMLFKNGELLNQSQKLTEYDEYLEEELGNKDAFIKLLYAGRRFKNILDLTKGERKDLIVDYLLEDLKKYEEYQAHVKKEYEAKVAKIKELEIRLENSEALKLECESLEADIKLSQMSLEACQAELESLEIKQGEWLKVKQINDTIKDKLAEKKQEQVKHSTAISSLTISLNSVNKRLQSGAVEYSELQKSLSNYGIDVFENYDEEELRQQKEEYERLTREDKKVKEGLETECKSILQSILLKQEDYFKLKENDLPCESALQIKCPLTDKRDIKKLLEDSEKTLEELQSKHETAVKQFTNYTVVNYTEEIEEINEKLKKLKKQREVQSLKDKLELLVITAKELKEEKQSIENNMLEPKTRLEALNDVIKNLEKQLTDTAESDCSSEISDIKIEIAKITTKIEENTIRLERNKIKISELSNLEAELVTLKSEADEYPLLIEFFSNTGAKVFDLQNAGNQISDVANSLLSNYKNKNVKIKFETLRANSKGELKEVFDIANSMDGGDWKTQASDGETVVISNSIREAMCYLRQTHDFKTVFIDELDGSIDSTSRVGFIKLLEDGAELNQRHHTFLISHSEEVKSYVEQKITLIDGEIVIS